jgi:hypothetical protein
MHTVQRVWDSTIKLFKHEKVEEVLKGELPRADLRLASTLVLVSSFLMAALSFVILLEQKHILEFAFDTASDQGIEVPALIGQDQVLLFAMFQLLFNVPFFVVFIFAYEGITFSIMKATGGKGSFTSQFYLSSLVMLAMALTSGLGLLTPLPCMEIIGMVALTVLTLYLILFVQVKAYQIVHEVSFLHSLSVVALLVVPRFWALFTVTNAAAAFFGLPQALDLGGV